MSISIGGGAKPAAAASSDAPRKPVSISIGGGAKPAASAAADKSDAPRKPVSISIGGASAAKKPEAEKDDTAAAASEKPAAPAAVAAVKNAEAPSSTTASAPSSRPESPAPAAAAKTESKVASLSNKPVATERATTNADQILAEATKVTDEETLKDLFGTRATSSSRT